MIYNKYIPTETIWVFWNITITQRERGGWQRCTKINTAELVNLKWNHSESHSRSLYRHTLSLSLSLSFLSWFISNVPFAIKPGGSSLKTDRPGEAGVSRDHQSCMDAAVWLCGWDKKNKRNTALQTSAGTHTHKHTDTQSIINETPCFFSILFPFQSLPFHVAPPSLLSLSFPVPLPSLSLLSPTDVLAH